MKTGATPMTWMRTVIDGKERVRVIVFETIITMEPDRREKK